MDNRIFVIHGSEIIQQGLYSLIKSLFKVETVLLSSVDELKNYNGVKNTRLTLLADSQVDQYVFEKTVNSFDVSNSVKIVLIRESSDKSICKDECDCCLSINDPKSKILKSLTPYLLQNNNLNKRKNTAWLTEREIDVIKLVAFGKINKEIAEELYISIHTVISHRKNITEKLGIKSISGLTVYAILNNLIDATKIDPDALI